VSLKNNRDTIILAAALAGLLAGGADQSSAVEEAIETMLLMRNELNKLDGAGPGAHRRRRDDVDD
jgi:hypothetical protein